MNFAKPEPRTWSRCGAALPADAPGATGIELRSADFSPLRSGPPKTAGSGLRSALLSGRNSLNSMAVGMEPLRWWRYQDAPPSRPRLPWIKRGGAIDQILLEPRAPPRTRAAIAPI